MHVLTIAHVLVLLTLANGAPVMAKLILRKRCAMPLDGNRTFIDGKPLFGASKTIRGVVVAVVATGTGAAPRREWTSVKTNLDSGRVWVSGALYQAPRRSEHDGRLEYFCRFWRRQPRKQGV